MTFLQRSVHDVGELSVGVGDGLVVADDEVLEGVVERLELLYNVGRKRGTISMLISRWPT